MIAIPGVPETAHYNSIPLDAGTSPQHAAWIVNDLFDVKRSLDKRGTDTLIPGADEHVRNPRRPTVSRRLIPMTFFGFHDSDGAAYSDPKLGLDTNLFEFQEAVVETTGDHDFVLYLRGGLAIACLATIEDFTIGDVEDNAVKAVLDLSLNRKLLESAS